MPVILGPENWPLWLGETQAEPERLKSLLVPYPADAMAIWPVDRRVGNVKNNAPRWSSWSSHSAEPSSSQTRDDAV